MNLIEKLDNELKSRGFSQKTQKSYIFHIKEFLRYNDPETPNNESVQKYFVSLSDQFDPRTIIVYDITDWNNMMSYTICRMHNYVLICYAFYYNLRIASVKFLFRKVLKRNIYLNYMKRPKCLPDVLTKDEIVRIISNIANRKHRLIVQLLYGCGLRVSEIVNRTKWIFFENPLILQIHGQ